MSPMRLPLSLAITVGATLAHPANGSPQPAPFTGTKQLKIKATASYDPVYPARDLFPPLEVTISSTDARGRSVKITDVKDKVKDKPPSCSLSGRIEGDKLTLEPNQTCNLADVATPDFCVLVDKRCDEHLSNRRCDQERASAGTLQGSLIQGSVTQLSNGAWDLSLDLAVDGCVLAEGYNNGAPVRVRGGSVAVRTQP